MEKLTVESVKNFETEVDYTTVLENFEGPLDLLLHLIKQEEIEIKDIFVSQVTEQFLSYMKGLPYIDLEKASEYLMLGLRTTRGICESEYRSIYPADFSLILEKLKICEKHGWAVNNNDRWNFTPKGFLLSNILIGQVLDAQSEQGYVTPRPWQSEDELRKLRREAMYQKDIGDNAPFHGI